MKNQLTIKSYKHPDIKYKFIKKLGDGSASKIYISENKKTGEKVIIKCINKKEEWRSEYNVLKCIQSLDSPNLLKLLDMYETYRFVYIVTSFYEGKDLFDHIDLNVPYPENFAKMMVKEMALRIKECHDNDIAHLDIKCENYMVKKMTPKPEFVLIDFGHAEKVDDKIKRGYSKYGTSFYLCPEGYDKIYSKKSDVWSLGVCTHLILSGDYPFDGHSSDYFKSGYLSIDDQISKDAYNFITNCMQFNPEDRYSIDEVLNSSFLR